MHKFRASDPRTDEIGEGLSPCQVTLDQAAHLMDAVGTSGVVGPSFTGGVGTYVHILTLLLSFTIDTALGQVEGGWEGARADLSQKYREGGYPEMSAFIMA